MDANRPDGGFAGCTGVAFDAQNGIAPLDILWVIDNSGSMDQEAALVQSGMNDFVGAIAAAGIVDYHVIVMVQSGWVTVPPPLGTDPAHFLFVDQDVQSHDAFARTLERFPAYSSFLRPTSALHLVFVTDDESDMPATTFQPMMEALLGRTFTAHVIVSPPGSTHTMCVFGICLPPEPGCDGPYGQGSDNGQQYWDLATRTGGLHNDICSADWTLLFSNLTSAVAVPMPIPCRFTIPDPPMGMTFDRDRVNVVYTPGGATDGMTIPRVSDGCASGRGWMYDDPAMPREIILCPDTCTEVTNDMTGSVDIQLGCATLLI